MNGSQVHSGQKDKRPVESQPAARNKRRWTTTTTVEVETAPICGVGPPTLNSGPPAGTEPVTVPPLQGYKSLATSRLTPANAATDVWHFMRPLNRKEKPEEWPPRSTDGSEFVEKPLDCWPKSAYVGCKLCLKWVAIIIRMNPYLITRRWHVWKVTDGMTTTLRTHLEDKHADIYPELCDRLHLKHAHRTSASSAPTLPEEFTLEGFRKRLTHFIAADDQVFMLVLLSLITTDEDRLLSLLILSSVKSFKNYSPMLGLEILKIRIYHIGRRQHSLSLRSMKSVMESRKSGWRCVNLANW